MFKRKLSLYFGSISFGRSLQAISLWCFPGKKSDARRTVLHQLVKKTYCPASTGVFSFGSGRSALTACLKAAGIGMGDEVLLSAYTCLAVPTAVIAAGATPVYCDIAADSLNCASDSLFNQPLDRVRAIVVQHTLGKPADVSAVLVKARKHGILVIEDCALAVGSIFNKTYVGNVADAAIVSMELSKTLSSGWGGLLITHNQALANQVSLYYPSLNEPSWWSASRDLWQTIISSWCYQPIIPYWIEKYLIAAAFKSRVFRPSTPTPEFEGVISSQFVQKMGGLQAGLAAYQWRDFLTMTAKCANNGQQLRAHLSTLNWAAPGAPETGEVAVAPRVSLLVNNRAFVLQFFKNKGIELGQWFDGPLSPMPTNPAFNYQSRAYPVAECIAARVVNLPCHARLTVADLQHVMEVLSEFNEKHPDCVVKRDVLIAKNKDLQLENHLCVQ